MPAWARPWREGWGEADLEFGDLVVVTPGSPLFRSRFREADSRVSLIDTID